MIRIDFMSFNEGEPFKPAIDSSQRRMQRERELAIVEAIEIIEGKVCRPDEFAKHGSIQQANAGMEVFVWKSQPLLIFRYSPDRKHIFIEKNY